MTLSDQKEASKTITVTVLIALAILFLIPIFMVAMNSFKMSLYVSREPFDLVTQKTFAGLNNYKAGLNAPGFFLSFCHKDRGFFLTFCF